MTNEVQGYTMTDRGTWLAMKDKLDLEILLKGDPVLFNPYGVIAVNPEKHSHVDYEGAMAFITFLTGSGGKIVLVQQEPYLFHSTVYQNLISPVKFSGAGHKNRDHLVREKLAMVGLNGFEKRKARKLSGKEKKRVAIALALMTEPETLLLDEPDANVDSRTTKELET